MKDELVRFLPWDTNHFGYRIGRARIQRLDAESYQQLRADCAQAEIDCLYFLADAADQASILELQRHGFIFVDIRCTLEWKVPVSPSAQHVKRSHAQRNSEEAVIRFASVDDGESLAAIASGGFTATRFFADPILSNEKAAAMYQIWLGKSLSAEYAEQVIVAEVKRNSVGFVTGHLDKESREGKIGLVALARSARGRGLARLLVNHALNWFRDQEMNRVSVVTQGRNIAAQRAYQRCGFLTRSTELWFHKWFRDMP